jgi:predicted SAM-dependent methyltransferase
MNQLIMTPSSIELNAVPTTMSGKLRKYSARYGYLSLVPRYLGRLVPGGWKYLGPSVTRSYLINWLQTDQRKILNLGGGGNCLESCLTADIDPRADVYIDITKPLPLPDESVDSIFCEEAIEHVSKSAGEGMLRECFRILKPGGIIRIATPDLDYFAARLNGDEINAIFYEHSHVYLYTRQELLAACQRAQFQNIRTYACYEGALGYLDSHAIRFEHPPDISQYVEAQKA